MPTLTLTEVVGEPSSWQVKNGPAAGQTMHSYKVRDDTGVIYEINRKPTSGPPELGTDEFEVTPPKQGTSFPAKIKRVQKGGAGNAAKDAYWERREQRDIDGIARMGRAHAQEMAVRLFVAAEPQHDGRTAKTYLPTIFALADEFDRDVNRVAGVGSGGAGPPAASPSTPPGDGSSPAASATTGFVSQPQQDLFARLLKEAGADTETANAIVLYAETLTSREISEAIEALKVKEHREAALGVLTAEAIEWRAKQSDIPADTADLPATA